MDVCGGAGGLYDHLNLRSLKSVANFNTVIVVLQVVLIAVILGMVVYGVFEGEGAGTLASTRPFWSGDAHVIPMITGATILCFSFTGFDGISNLSEETKDAERVIRVKYPDRADRRHDLHLCNLLPAAVLPGYLSL